MGYIKVKIFPPRGLFFRCRSFINLSFNLKLKMLFPKRAKRVIFSECTFDQKLYLLEGFDFKEIQD